MAVYLLLIWVGGHSGYISVPDLPSVKACDALAAEINAGMGYTRSHRCVPYEKARP